MECVRLRVKDVDFEQGILTVRDGKGAKDRVTMLPGSAVEPLRAHLQGVRRQHEEDVKAGHGEVYLAGRIGQEMAERRSGVGVALGVSVGAIVGGSSWRQGASASCE
jgi:site-specific recombinase XerD